MPTYRYVPRDADVPTPESPFASNVALRTIGARFLIGQRVRHVTDDVGATAGVVTEVHIHASGFQYLVAFGRLGGDESRCIECELIDADDQPTGVA